MAPDSVLRHVGTADRGALRRAVGVAPWGGAVGLAVLWPTRRVAPWRGVLVRARGPSAAWGVDRRQRCTRGGVGISV